jgi:hypothetical protein
MCAPDLSVCLLTRAESDRDSVWRQMKYTWLPLSAYLSFERLCEEVHRLLGGYGADHAINFE